MNKMMGIQNIQYISEWTLVFIASDGHLESKNCCEITYVHHLEVTVMQEFLDIVDI